MKFNNVLIAECTVYDFKEMLERKKVKSWLKSISAFSNTEGGSLFYGINNDGIVVGLKDAQSDSEFISETIKARIDPIPDFEIIPFEYNSKQIIEVKVKVGNLTPYYYYQDGARMDFIKNHTMHGWVKMPNYRLNIPDYAERALFEGMVNHLIHRDYTLIGAEVHIDIYDDRIELVSPGAMLDGTQIQDRNIYDVPSMRRNPVIADVFTQLDYMEKRGSGLRKIKEITELLPNYKSGKSPTYRTIGGSFYTTFYNLNCIQEENVGVYKENVGVNEENVGVNKENVGVNSKSISRTGQKILDLVVNDQSITLEKIAENISITKRSVERQVKTLRDEGILIHEGSDKTGYWRIIS